MKKRIGIVGADPFNGNRGVGALIYSVIYLLRNIEEHRTIESEIYILLPIKGKTSETFIIGDKYIRVNYIYLTNFYGIKAFIRSIFHLYSYLKYLKLDLILFIGGGDSFSDIYGMTRFHEINNSIKLFRFLRKKQIMLPQTIGPFKESFCKRCAIKSIEGASIVFARDKLSFDYVSQIAKQPDLIESIDVAFALPYTQRSFNKQLVNVGIGISALLWNGGYTRNNQFNLTIDYRKIIIEIIEFFLKQDKVMIHLVPHVVSTNRGIENDYEVSLDVMKYFNSKRVILSPLFLDPMEAKSYISGLDFFTGSRMHACIAAFSSQVPVFPLSYSRKFNGLFEETLDYNYVGDMTKNSKPTIFDQLSEAFSNRLLLKEITKERMNIIVLPRLEILVDHLLNCINEA